MDVSDILFIISICLSLISLSLALWSKYDSIKERKESEEKKKKN